MICFKYWDMQFWLKFAGKFCGHISPLVICWGGAELYFYRTKQIKELCRNNGTKDKHWLFPNHLTLLLYKIVNSFGVHKDFRGPTTGQVNMLCKFSLSMCVHKLLFICCLDFVMAAGLTDSFFQMWQRQTFATCEKISSHTASVMSFNRVKGRDW